jgi:hypothetical protein
MHAFCSGSPMKLAPLAVAISLLSVGPLAAAEPTGPGPEYQIDPKMTQTSPEGTYTIEQYHKADANDDWTWQAWVRAKDSMDRATLLKPDQDYPAGFRFSNDLHYLVRMQKTGSGEATLYLYRLGKDGFESATAKPFGDLVWAFFYSRPESRKIKRPDFHMSVNLVKGLDEDYRWMGVDWPKNRYVVIALSGETDTHGQIGTVNDWRCRYDLQTGKFDVPKEFAENNAKALMPR